MHRFVSIAWRPAVAAVAVAVASLVGSSPALGQDAPITITGAGHVASTDFEVTVSAGPDGSGATGSLTTSGGPYVFTATVTCVAVAGATGVTGYRIDSGRYAGQGFLASARDGGPGGADEVLYSGIVATVPASCPAPSEAPPPFVMSGGGGTLTSGDLALVGGPPETTPPWRPSGSAQGGAVPGVLHETPLLALAPGRSVGPVRLGTRAGRSTSIPGVRTAVDRRGRVVTITSTSSWLTLHSRALDPGTARLRALLRRRGWSVGRCGALRWARRTARGATTTAVWRGARLSRVVVTSKLGRPSPCR